MLYPWLTDKVSDKLKTHQAWTYITKKYILLHVSSIHFIFIDIRKKKLVSEFVTDGQTRSKRSFRSLLTRTGLVIMKVRSHSKNVVLIKELALEIYIFQIKSYFTQKIYFRFNISRAFKSLYYINECKTIHVWISLRLMYR